MRQLLAALKEERVAQATKTSIPYAEPTSRAFPITTVSTNHSFDAYITVGFKDARFKGADPSHATQLIVDSGNTSLIVPRWEDLAAIPGYEANYQVMGQATEPWGCPANVVKGPIQLFDSTGDVFTIDDCIFFACTGDLPGGGRTANFGAGCIVPWSSSRANVISSLGITLQPVLSQTDFPYVEFDYAPMEPVLKPVPVHDPSATARASVKSAIRIHSVLPDGFVLMDIVRDCPWMSLIPTSLSIAGSPTQWPGALTSPIAMIDTGGGPVYLSDPESYLCSRQWPQPVANPAWAASLAQAQSIQAPVEITLGDEKTGSYSYIINTAAFPAADQGITLVISKQNSFMMGQQGMNVGGISALANAILVDYKSGRVGLKRRQVYSAPSAAKTLQPQALGGVA
jgi:hypothetical protein